jgi:ADP-ribose pyrophosphatase YjhB (NUDIX family)
VLAHDDALRDRLVANLAAHSRRAVHDDGQRRAAVAIVVAPSEAGTDLDDPYSFTPEEMSVIPGDTAGFDGSVSGVSGGASFLLCRRAVRMTRHAGQWALPGGRMDHGESAVDAARRELHEELGLDLPASAVLGLLDDYETRSGYVITPVVLWAEQLAGMCPDPAEVAQVYTIGLHELQRADSPRFVTIAESPRPVVQVPIGRDLIHAPTGAVLVQFRWVALEGRHGERVDGFEQPVFAWS